MSEIKGSKTVEKINVTNEEVASVESQDGGFKVTDQLYDMFLASQEYPVEQLEEDSNRVRCKLDMYLMPLLMFTYLLSFLDKQTLNYSNAYGLQEQLHMAGQDYSWAASAANFGQLIAAWPVNMMLQKVPVGRTLSVFVFFWGVVCLCTAASSSFGGLMAARVILGMVEAIIAPACMALTAMFYQRKEQSLRMSLWLGCNGIATMLGGVISWGCGHAHSSLDSYKLIYLVVGSITCAWSFVIFFLLPDTPRNAKMLTEYERIVAVYRIAKNKSGAKNLQYQKYQIKEAFMDPLAYAIWSLQFSLGLLNGGVANFTSTLFKAFGFTGMASTRLQVVGGAFELVSCFFFGFLAANVKNTLMFSISLAAVPGIAGIAGITSIPMKHKYALAACTWFQNTFGASIILSWSIPSVNITGHTKRGTVVGVGFVVFAAGNIISPHFFDSKDAPRFKPATTGLLVCYSWLILAPLCLAGFLHYRNKSRDRKGYIVADREEILAGFADQTDFENKGFRYIF